MIMSSYTLYGAVVILLFVAGATHAQSGEELLLAWNTVDGGGLMSSTGGGFELRGTIGQPDARALSGSGFVFLGGLWAGNIHVAAQAPRLIRIADGLGGVNSTTGLADTFMWPLGEECPLTEVSLEATAPLTLNGVATTYTGTGALPHVTLVNHDGGLHRLEFNPSPEAGEWVMLELDVTGKDSGRRTTLTVWLAHQPLDVNQDGVTNIRDATAFGEMFRGGQEPRLIDFNCDGQVNIRDATAFGENWNGTGPSVTRPWRNTQLPLRP